MAEYDEAGAGQGTAANAGASHSELTPAAKAKNITVNGAKVLLIGVVGIVLGIAGMAAVANADFPGVRLVGLLILFFLVVAIVAAVRGCVWLVQGLAAGAKAPK
ncbi:MAG: hypothetical protein QOE61_1326 [Micromonosporaceae bacterium]|jgi:hypothetical protein|nr:hypothetical protein [Micromonosporaceae bacterium]